MNKAMRTDNRAAGFTLLEVMVALVIFSICATTLIKQSGISLRQTHSLETRTLANWIASNELERLRLEGFPKIGNNSREIQYANRQWQIERRITSTNNPDLHRAVIQVSELSHDKTYDHQLIGFLGRH